MELSKWKNPLEMEDFQWARLITGGCSDESTDFGIYPMTNGLVR